MSLHQKVITQTTILTVQTMSERLKIYEHSSAWTRSDYKSKACISETLTIEHIYAFDHALKAVEESDIDVEDITRANFPLTSIEDSISRWVNEVQEGRGLLVLTGLPIERYSKEQCGKLFYGLGSYFGDAQSQSLMGDRLGHVVDVSGKDTRERAYRNSSELALHTDASDIIGMMCLVKAMEGGISGYSSGPAIYNYMVTHYPELLEQLFDGYQYHLFGEQEVGQSPVTDHKVPVFSMRDGYLSVSFLRSYIELAFEELGVGKSEIEARALDVFDKIAHCPEFRFDFMLEPGEMTFFNNYTVLHTRTAFFDDDDPLKKRHLLRLWLKAWTPRPLKEVFSQYGGRKGIKPQQGRGTYYQGNTQYVESPPPKI